MNRGKKSDLAVTGNRRRASGDGGNSKRFATVKMPDGREAKIPAVKDAATYICIATPDGQWPDRALSVLMYDVTWMVEGVLFEMEEMRPGYGMGEMTTLRVINSRNRLQNHEGCYGQMQRWLLCERMESVAERMTLSADDLLDGEH